MSDTKIHQQAARLQRRLGDAPRVTLRLRPELHTQLQRTAQARDVSPSVLIRAALLKVLEHELVRGEEP